MKTKIFSAFFILFLCLAAVGAVNASADTYGDLTYEVSGNTIEITGCNKSAVDVVIPSKIKGRTVTSIGDDAFRGRSSLRSITIPDSVTNIGKNAFYSCKNLNRVNIIDLAAWRNISFESFTANPLYIGCNLYLNGELVENLVIPDSVTNIGNYAFYGCESLKSITIPDSVASIGRNAFYSCKNLNRVDITDIAAWCKISFKNLWSNPLYYAHNLYLNGELVENLVIPDSVESISGYAFGSCSSLASVTIPDSVMSIGDSAFYGCENIYSVNITDLAAWRNISFESFAANPLYIGCNLYLNGELVENLVIPDSVTNIGNYAFYGCESLKSITIPDSVASIGRNAFYSCKNLNRVDITDIAAWCKMVLGDNMVLGDIIVLGDNNDTPFSYKYDLYLNGELVENLVIPDGITSVNDYAFRGCSSIRSVTIPDSVTSIGTSSFSGCTGLASVTIPDSVTSIGNYAFSNCYRLTSVTIPDSVTSIGDNAFYYCYSITSVTIPDSVTSIGDYAFENCSSLTSITIPGSVTSIGESAFRDCYRLTSVTIPGSVTSIDDSAFRYCKSLTSVTIPDSVTSIGDFAFSDCSSLTSITIPDSVTSIGDAAFNDCSSLTRITIPDSVTSIGDNAFYDCYSLTSVTIPEGLNVIPKSAFSYCCNLKAITIPASMEYIRRDAFSNCDNIKYVFFKGSRDFWDNEMLIYTGNDALKNAEIICDPKEKTYNFVTNCEKTLSPVTAYCIADAPNTETLSRKKYVTGWYDNPELSGDAVEFPYYGDKTTLYAKWADRTGGSFESAVYLPENGRSTINGDWRNTIIYKYWTFIPEKTGEYIFESTSDNGLYLYNSNKAELASGSNSITFSLAAGEVYYIMNTYMYSNGGTLTVTQADYKGTLTAISNNGKNIRVVPTDVETGTKIAVALYNGDKFVGTKVATYRGGAIEFTTNTEYTSIKVMAWDADNLTPCAKAEVVER